MATSERLLTVIAIRLAILVLAGFVARTAADRPRQQIASVVARTVVNPQASTAGKPEADETMRDMLLHD